MRKKIIIFKIIFLFGSAAFVYGQQKTATYKDLSPNIFASYNQPIGIGILKFEGSDDLHTKLYDELKKQPGIHDKFTIFPYDVLEQQKGVLGIIGEITLDNQKALNLLRENLEIKLVISGNYLNSNEFEMRINRTNDGQGIFESKYENSTNSTGMKDAVNLFSEKRDNEYEERQIVELSKMILVEGENFIMGNNEGNEDEKPEHKVKVNSFYIDKYEVTQKEYERVMGNNPSYFKCSDCPVENVSWNDAMEFARKVGKRLPTEAEWEYAARGGNKSKNNKYSGGSSLDLVGWYTENSNYRTHYVGEKIENELGINDMTGNVLEWCSDWYHKLFYNKREEDNPTGYKTGNYKVARGGCWCSSAQDLIITHREFYDPNDVYSFVGFRCVKDHKHIPFNN